ncbi:YbaN family protein [Marinomonas sp. TW1]|uniref:YbaN family protein n=1 Tax=Marinomonas sp. TW1 TaxID=1561203 RepID=UPI000AED801D|nr:YbaN family protein [Marinomonas sp. TW1]
MLEKSKNFIYQIIAVVSLGLAIFGVITPGFPATEFVLLCAWSSAKGSPRIHAFLHTNRLTGPVLHNWKNGKVISLNNKIFSSISMLLCVFFLLYSDINLYLVAFALFGISISFILVWSRPSRLNTDKEL